MEYVHSVLCETYMVQWYFIELCTIGGGVHMDWVYVHYATC